MTILRGAEPFLSAGGENGVMLVHGFTGSPSHMRTLGAFLNKGGFTVLCPRIYGHGTSVKDLASTNYNHWYSSVEDGYHLLKAMCRNVSVVGLSMGGLLALKLAAEYPITKVVTVNTPIFIADKRLSLLPIYRLFMNYVPKKRRKVNVDPVYNVSYDYTPLNSLSSLIALIKHVSTLLPDVSTKSLILQSLNELSVQPRSAEYIFERLGTHDKRLIWLNLASHLVTIDAGCQQVFSYIGEFMADKEAEGLGSE